MPHHRARLVVLDPNGARELRASVIGPADMPRQNVLGSLQPFEADDGRSCGLGLSALDAAPGKRINLLARDRRFGLLRAAFPGHALPRVRHVVVKLVRIEPMDDTPCAAAKSHSLFPL